MCYYITYHKCWIKIDYHVKFIWQNMKIITYKNIIFPCRVSYLNRYFSDVLNLCHTNLSLYYHLKFRFSIELVMHNSYTHICRHYTKGHCNLWYNRTEDDTFWKTKLKKYNIILCLRSFFPQNWFLLLV